jgi:hypothetical protein
MPHTLTREMLATALQRLEASQSGETAPLDGTQLRQRAEEVAEAALQAIAVCVKYMLASNGESTVDGLGSFVLQNGHIQFAPESDVLQYALLKHQDETSQRQALSEAFVRNLSLAWSILPMIEPTNEMKVSGPLEFVAEDRLLEAIFEQTLPNRFDVVVTTLLSLIIRHLRSVGLTIQLPSDATTISENEETRAFLSTKADEGRDYAQRKARELRERADALIERSKEVAARQKDSLSAAVEYERHRIAEEGEL